MPGPEVTPLDGHAMEVRSHKVVRLGPVRIDIRSNELDFKGFRFFSESVDPDSQDLSEAPPDFVLSLCNLNVDGPWPIKGVGAPILDLLGSR